MNRYPATRPWPTPLRLLAVSLWASFIGAALTTMLLVTVAPQLEHDGRFTWETLGLWFLLNWIVAMLPIGFGLVLFAPPPSER